MTPIARPKVGFVAYSLVPGMGGIPRVARLIARTLESLASAGRLDYQCLTFDRFGIGSSRFSAFLANLKMLGAQRRLALSCSHFIYDSCQMAQLHHRPWPLGSPSLTFIHGIEVWERAKPRWLAACKHSTLLACNSAFTRHRAHQLHGDFASARISWLATESDSPPPQPAHTEIPTVLIVSRIDKQEAYKGHRELIQAWPQVTQAVPAACLRIVGKGNGLEELRQAAAALPCKDNIQFDGFVPDDKLEEIYQKSSVFAMPSRGEGFGIVYIEAMRCGLPVITSRQDAGQEVIVDGQTGYAVDLNDSNALVQRIVELLSNPSRARQLGQAGQERWRQYFTPHRFVERFGPIIEELLKLPA